MDSKFHSYFPGLCPKFGISGCITIRSTQLCNKKYKNSTLYSVLSYSISASPYLVLTVEFGMSAWLQTRRERKPRNKGMR